MKEINSRPYWCFDRRKCIGGGGSAGPLANWPLIEPEFVEKKNERVTHEERKPMIPNVNTYCTPL